MTAEANQLGYVIKVSNSPAGAPEARWQTNERELARIAAIPGLDPEMHAADTERIEAEQDRIEWQLGL